MIRSLLHGTTFIAGIASLCLLGACSSTKTTLPVPVPTPVPALVRAVHGSPDAPKVDIFLYTQGTTRPTAPAVAAAAYPQITNYLNLTPGTYVVDVVLAGAPTGTAAVASETVTVASGTQYSIVVGGLIAKNTLRFVNFVEPAEATGTTALIVHHASTYVQNALNGPVGVGVFDASKAAPASIAQLFGFQLTSGVSGPATSGSVSGGEYFLSPLPAGLPAAVGFAAGAPAAGGATFTTLVSATPTQLASGLQNPTTAEQTLAGDTASAVPAGAHISIFAVDTQTAAQLIGTLDP